jgi:hypothetical protein
MVTAAAVGVGYESLGGSHSHPAGTPAQGGRAVRVATHASVPGASATKLATVRQRGWAWAGKPQRHSGRAAARSSTAGHSRVVPTRQRTHSKALRPSTASPSSTVKPAHGPAPAHAVPAGQSGASHGVAHAYGHATPEHVTPPGHAYGHTKPKKQQSVTTPAATPVTPPGQAKQPGTPATGKAKGQLTR